MTTSEAFLYEMRWRDWVASRWRELVAGGELAAPAALPPLERSGFSRPWVRAHKGQSADWVLSLDDGSRVHVHVYADGRRVAHRDRFDPARGPVHTLLHVATETPIGKLVARVGAAATVGTAWRVWR